MNNKTIWITGASSGIGKSLALKFAKEGWKVAISARRENLLNEISKSNDSINAFPLDVTDKEKCKSVFSEVKEKLGEIDISVFCTGIHDPKSEKTLNLEKVREIMEVNFFGTINSINAVYEYYKSKKSGQISIVSSVAVIGVFRLRVLIVHLNQPYLVLLRAYILILKEVTSEYLL